MAEKKNNVVASSSAPVVVSGSSSRPFNMGGLFGPMLLVYPIYTAWSKEYSPEKYLLIGSLAAMTIPVLLGYGNDPDSDAQPSIEGVAQGLFANVGLLETAALVVLGYCAFSFWKDKHDTLNAVLCAVACLSGLSKATRTADVIPFA